MRNVVITGGSRGIGAAAVELFAAQGHRVFFLYEKEHEAAKTVADKTGATAICCDVSKAADVQCIYYADTVLHVIATNGTWSQVYNKQTNQSGFMMNAYLNKYLNK